MRMDGTVPGLDFDPETDLAVAPAWFLDGTHSVPPMTPMFSWFWNNFCRHGLQYGPEKISLPTAKGLDMRNMRGGDYIALLPVKSDEEKAEREKRFRDAIRPFVTDWDGLWQGFIREMLGHYEGLKKLDLDKASNIELLENFEQTVDVTRRMWEVHMYMMYGTFCSYVLFENMCRELIGIDDTHPTFHKLIAGFDNKILQVDKRIWEFSQKAKAMGIAQIFLGNEAKEIHPALKADPKGREFLAEFYEFLDEDGWKTQRIAEINLPTWIEDPTPPLVNVKQFLVKGGGFNLEEERAKLTKERLEAEAEVLAKISPEQKPWFTTLLRLAQKSGIFSEEHDHYLDLYCHAMIRRSVLGIGRRLTHAGTIDAPEDIFYLIPEDVRRVLLSPAHYDLRPIAQKRKAEWQEWCKEPNPPFIFKDGYDLNQAMGEIMKSNDPIFLKVVVGSMPVVRPELKADLHGTCGSPGVAEGIARVVLQEEQLSEVQPGEILVAAATSPSWTPVFSFIAGVVVDRGASLSHAAIVGREYGIPVLMNVFTGTQVIKTGQRIRIDANMGVLYILDKEPSH
ncbi:MAG: phosphoenolpyruvate-utilizing protein [Deltaproteobacteria bacterium]|nr:phosphoenolpyruvate-utilizing protein [Deltaproteobacteria bacterium]